MGLQEQIVARGKGLVAAEGYGQLDPKQRKNGEMQNVMSAADSKFDLFLTNFMMGVEDLFKRIAALHMQYDPEWMQLRGEFKYIPTATSSTVTPQLRQQLAQAKLQAQQSYFAALMQMPPEIHPMLWHSYRTVLIDLGDRQPEAYLGPEPQTPQPVPAQVQQLVAQGMPAQMALQMLAGQQGAPQQGQPMPQAGLAQLMQASGQGAQQ
jgi:hypothetical protein